ncbi:hypothetical protein LshimejAT787_0604230 [Lyophyllum shimeji]|uniref:Uncharacterized protein n=1 Tax=Lyophyllum shimeji TaxID=47721 RepID=A0A9P3PP86_LYOSH|nr:hypothetical protein LshimejAT787_0604230 [Lyophyllum shimeji]
MFAVPPTTAAHPTDQTLDSYASEVTAVSADELGRLDETEKGATYAQTTPAAMASSQQRSSVLPLPKGAVLLPLSSSAYHPDYSRNVGNGDTPPSTPSQRLLDHDLPHVQFASYRNSREKMSSPQDSPTLHSSRGKGWVPWPLRPRFWIPFILMLALGAVGLEIALHFSNKNQGWPTKRDVGSGTGILHYVYTLPPVAVASILVALWTWTDIEIKKLQPYVDLVHGDSPPHRSLLLDYTRTNNFIVWTSAAYNKHYLVALASLMVVLSLSFQPLAAALLVVKDTWLQVPDVTLNNLAAIGLNQGGQFNDLTAFVTAAGYASASVLYRLGDPPFIHGPYTVAPFQLPTNLVANGTVFANTTAIKTDPGCVPADADMVQRSPGDPNGAGWTNSASVNGCGIVWVAGTNGTTVFGVDLPACNTAPAPQFSPVVFWFFTYEPSPRASATFCFPSLTFWDVNVNVDLASGNLTQVTELRPFSASSNFSSLSANVTGAPLLGRAYNGIQFNLTNPDQFVLGREASIKSQLPAAIYQAAVQSSEGLLGSFEANRFVELSTRVYTTYLTLVARTVYFLPNNEPITMQVKTIHKRVWLSDTAVHLLAAAMLLLAFFGTLVHLFHRADRRRLRLRHEPGTIASAVSIGAQTGMGNLLAGRQDQREITQALRNKKFRIDPETMKIIMEGEEGYETAASPTQAEGRKSIFAALQGQRRLSKRFSVFSSKATSVPSTPRPANDNV